MSSSTGRTGEAGAINAGDYRAVIGLFPNNFHEDNKPKDGRVITPFVTEFEISEGLNQSSLLGKLTIRDGVNLLEDMRISGGEKIQVMVSQEEPIGPDETLIHKINHAFHISDVINYSRSLAIQTYQLQLVSRTSYLNQLKIKNNAFSNSIGEEVKLILNELMGDSKQNLFINSGGGNFKGCYPQLRPMAAINWLRRNAFDDGTPFYFFESLNYNTGDEDKKGGLVFESYKGLLKQIADKIACHQLGYSENSYHMTPYSHGQDQGQDQFSRSKRILGISTNLGMSKWSQIAKGAYGSRLTTIDIARKTVSEVDYAYAEGQPSLVLGNMYKPFAMTDRAKFNDQTLDEYQGRRLYSSINSLSMGDSRNYHSPLENESNQLQKSISIEENLNYMQHEIELYGDFNLFPGTIIYIEVPKSADPETIKDGEEPRDELQSGIYIVTRINHIFKNNEYRMKVKIAKDASMLDLDSKTPSPKG